MANNTEIPEPLNTPEFRELWKDWIDAHGGPRYTARQRRMALKRLDRWGHDAALAALEHSLAAGYQGIFPDPTFQSATQKVAPATRKVARPLSVWEIKEKIREIDNRLDDSDLYYEKPDPEKEAARKAERRRLAGIRKNLKSKLLEA